MLQGKVYYYRIAELNRQLAGRFRKSAKASPALGPKPVTQYRRTAGARHERILLHFGIRFGRPSRQGRRPDLRRHPRRHPGTGSARPRCRRNPLQHRPRRPRRRNHHQRQRRLHSSCPRHDQAHWLRQHRLRHRLQGLRRAGRLRQAEPGHRPGRQQGLRRRSRPGRRRPGPDVRLRLRRNPVADAAADLPVAPPGRTPGHAAQGRPPALGPPRRQVAGHHQVRRRQPLLHRHRRAVLPAFARHQPGGPARGDHRTDHQAGAAQGTDQGRHQVPGQPDRPLRRRRPAGRLRPDRPQDHCRHLRRGRPGRWRRLLRQGPVQGRPLRRVRPFRPRRTGIHLGSHRSRQSVEVRRRAVSVFAPKRSHSAPLFSLKSPNMLKKISVQQLSLGMHLKAFCGAWLDHPFWRTQFVLSDPNDITLILESPITEVWIDISKDIDVAPSAKEDAAPMVTAEEIPEHAPVVQEKSSFNDEVKRAAKICAKGKEAVVSMFQEARMGKAIEAEAAAPLVEEISNSVMRNPGALISLARLKTADDYTFMHSVAVCALMIALARQLGLDETQVREAGMAGLLHDLGKAMIPLEVLNKPGKLTDAEFDLVKTHPEEGHKLLLEGQGVSELTRDVCLHHHEKIDGSGYPRGLNGDTMSLFAKMGAVCDVYDAVTSNRPYKAGWDPAASIARMAQWQGHFDPKVFQAFVVSIGIYPIGSLVRLESGKLGVVIEQGEQSLLKPKVKVFFSTKAQAYIKPEVIDLARSPEKIAGREEAAKWGLKDIDRYWVGDKA